MKLGEFIDNFIEHNSLIRLVYKEKGGHKIVLDDWADATMEWEILKAKSKNRHYIDNKVLGIASIHMNCNNREAINIVIEKLENQPFIEEVVEVNINNGNSSI